MLVARVGAAGKKWRLSNETKEIGDRRRKKGGGGRGVAGLGAKRGGSGGWGRVSMLEPLSSM